MTHLFRIEIPPNPISFPGLFQQKKKVCVLVWGGVRCVFQQKKKCVCVCVCVGGGRGAGSSVSKVSCIYRHRGVKLILAYSWARPAILTAGKDRGGMFLFLLFFFFFCFVLFFTFIPVPLSSLSLFLISSTISFSSILRETK